MTLTDKLDVTTAYAYLDTEVTKSTNPFELGGPLPLAPKHQASAWVDYTFATGALAGLRLGGGIRFIGDFFGETETPDSLLIPAYTLFDGALSYDLGRISPKFAGMEFAINATNLTDEYHVVYCFGTTYCNLGESRTILSTLRYRW